MTESGLGPSALFPSVLVPLMLVVLGTWLFWTDQQGLDLLHGRQKDQAIAHVERASQGVSRLLDRLQARVDRFVSSNRNWLPTLDSHPKSRELLDLLAQRTQEFFPDAQTSWLSDGYGHSLTEVLTADEQGRVKEFIGHQQKFRAALLNARDGLPAALVLASAWTPANRDQGLLLVRFPVTRIQQYLADIDPHLTLQAGSSQGDRHPLPGKISGVAQSNDGPNIERPVPGTPWRLSLAPEYAPARLLGHHLQTLIILSVLLASAFITLVLLRRIGYQRQDMQQQRDRLSLRLTKAQQRLVHSERLASLGGLVAGIAHEINTPVGIGVTAASHLSSEVSNITHRLDDNTMRRSDLKQFLTIAHDATEIIQANMQRASDLIRSFKQVAIDQTHKAKRHFELPTYLDAILLSLRPHLKQAPHRISVECPDEIELYSYPGAFSQVITNLITNALLHAFPGHQAGSIRIHVKRETERVKITFSDNGQGIPEDIQARVFEPFFTTAEERGGTGLGLHLVKQLITQKLGGSILCYSRVGKGTEFELALPLDPDQVGRKTRPQGEGHPRRNSLEV